MKFDKNTPTKDVLAALAAQAQVDRLLVAGQWMADAAAALGLDASPRFQLSPYADACNLNALRAVAHRAERYEHEGDDTEVFYFGQHVQVYVNHSSPRVLRAEAGSLRAQLAECEAKLARIELERREAAATSDRALLESLPEVTPPPAGALGTNGGT